MSNRAYVQFTWPLAAGIALGSLVLSSCAKRQVAGAVDTEFQKKTQAALILAKPGSVIELPAGKFHLDRTLSLTVDHVTVRGKGMDKTVLSFDGQKSGAAGLQVTASDFTIEDVALEDTAGDALKVTGGTNITVRRVRTEWTRGPKETNGPYGIYPVQCQNVLVEDSVAVGASDAGIYVGQSSHVIVRHNRAENNVAGIEIENSQYADVAENTATGNTGGILVFNLPDLPVQDGKFARVFNNRILSNNTSNFAPKGDIVAKVPTGTGLMIMATNHIEVFKNTIRENHTSNVSIVSYFVTENPIQDKRYDPYTSAVYVHDNDIAGGGTDPAGFGVNALALVVGKPLGDIVYDGIVDPKMLKAAQRFPDGAGICLENNGGAKFLDFDAANNFVHFSRDPAPHRCSLPPLEAVTLPAAPPNSRAREE